MQKLHDNQNIKIVSKDKIGITNFFLLPLAPIWLSTALNSC